MKFHDNLAKLKSWKTAGTVIFQHSAESELWVYSMKKRLTEAQFQAAIKDLEVSQQTLEIAHGVLVEGVSQTKFAASLNLSRGAVSQTVNRVWLSHEERNVPKGFERVTVVLPEHQAFIVKKWAVGAVRKTEI
ncbi:transcriptional regulator KorA [Xylella fastidiosa]|uniref:transcriptional regulator KorA n=1 Tax=Xylella fastidiosa TaxID=2371 RepID=UPI00351A1BF6